MATYLHNKQKTSNPMGQTCRRSSGQDRIWHGSCVCSSSTCSAAFSSCSSLSGVRRLHLPPPRLPAGGEGNSATEESWFHTCSYPHTYLASGCCSHPGTYDTIPANFYNIHIYWHSRSLLSARHRPGLSTAHRGQHSEELRWHWYSPGLLGKVWPHTKIVHRLLC